MITAVIKQLQEQDWLGVSEDIDIAKGRDEIVTTWRGMIKHIRRIVKSRRYGKRL